MQENRSDSDRLWDIIDARRRIDDTQKEQLSGAGKKASGQRTSNREDIKSTKSAPSQRKIEANRENAKHSTGPTGAEGKLIVSQNAIKHGVTATRVQPIRHGPFAEDPELFEEEVAALVASFGPPP